VAKIERADGSVTVMAEDQRQCRRNRDTDQDRQEHDEGLPSHRATIDISK